MTTNETLQELFSKTKPEHIWLSSDWHIFQNKYKHENRKVNVTEIAKFCKEKIKPDEIFMYLGDLTFRWANKEDQKKAQEFYKSLPGIKVLILGNHDIMVGKEFYSNCGFDYILEQFEYENLIFTHRPIDMTLYPDEYINIHGHIHNMRKYNTSDGGKNINVYPFYYNGKPITLKYILAHKDSLIADNEWNDNAMLGEKAIVYQQDVEDPAYQTKLAACVEQNDLLSSILNMQIVSEFTINDFIRGGGKENGIKFILETKRSQIPDEDFGIPKERKYPLDDEEHVRSAIKFFNYVDKKYEKELALNIKRKMKEYKIDDVHMSEKNRLTKYLNEFYLESSIYLIDQIISGKHEWSMAAMNPVQGVSKPFIFVTGDNEDPTKDDQLLFAPDLISPKYITVDENGYLKFEEHAYLENKSVDIYEFIGDKERIKSIQEAFASNKQVDSKFLYTTLAEKPILSRDQIMYDENFVKVDIESLKELN